ERRAEIKIAQRIDERNEKYDEQEQCDEAQKGFTPPGILQALGIEGQNLLVRFAKIRRVQRFIDTLKARVEDMEAAGHAVILMTTTLFVQWRKRSSGTL